MINKFEKLFLQEGSVNIPLGNGINFTARWDPKKEKDIHAMVEVPIQSLKWLVNQINELGVERDKLRDVLEDARMG